MKVQELIDKLQKMSMGISVVTEDAEYKHSEITDVRSVDNKNNTEKVVLIDICSY